MTRNANNDRAKMPAANNGTIARNKSATKIIIPYYLHLLSQSNAGHSAGRPQQQNSITQEHCVFIHFFSSFLLFMKGSAPELPPHQRQRSTIRIFRSLWCCCVRRIFFFACRSIKPINHRCCDMQNNVWIHQRQLNKCQTKRNETLP